MREKRKYADRAKYLIVVVAKRRKKIRDMAIEFKGGKCNICGYDKCNAALELHHIDKRKKDFGLSMNGITRSWEKTKKELQKCILVCSNCHREIHSGITQLSGESRIEK